MANDFILQSTAKHCKAQGWQRGSPRESLPRAGREKSLFHKQHRPRAVCFHPSTRHFRTRMSTRMPWQGLAGHHPTEPAPGGGSTHASSGKVTPARVAVEEAVANIDVSRSHGAAVPAPGFGSHTNFFMTYSFAHSSMPSAIPRCLAEGIEECAKECFSVSNVFLNLVRGMSLS